MGAESETTARGRAWRFALGPALFLLVELLFEPNLVLREAHPTASPELVRHTLAATLWIASWWFTEALPIPATSLLPLVLFPVLGLGSAAEVSRLYAHEIIFLFLGGLLLALAMERTGLHERVAIGIIRLFGRGRRGLVLGFMVATATMSMWISNTATTVMLLPVALAVLASAEGEGKIDEAFPPALLLGLAFAANIGGLGTPIGSPPNIIFQNIYREKTGLEVSFGEWMLFGVPLIALLLPATWWFLVRRLEPGEARGQGILPRFGPMTIEQRWVLGTFLVTAFLWMTRGDFGPLAGWGTRLAEHGVHLRASTVAVAAALVLFGVTSLTGRELLDWRDASSRLPWGVLLLMGAGFAISNAFDRSGLTVWMGGRIEALGHLALPPQLLLLGLLAAVVAVSIVVTEFASNTASANILLPIVFGVSAALGPERFPPDLLMVSCALGSTTGFAVPAGTPPNALVFATERVSIGAFVRRGVVVDLFSLVLIVAWIGTFALLR